MVTAVLTVFENLPRALFTIAVVDFLVIFALEGRPRFPVRNIAGLPPWCFAIGSMTRVTRLSSCS